MPGIPGEVNELIGSVKGNLDDKFWWKQQFILLYGKLQDHYRDADRSVTVMEEDWDNLVILDACRYDVFEDTVDLSVFDTYHRKTSQGSLTPEWAQKNFRKGSYDDTVYVTANPWISKIADGSFYELVEPWRKAFDDRVGTVPADAVVNAALDHYEQDKRLVAHFMQPHPPFIEKSNGRADRILDADRSHWTPTRITGDSEDEVYNVWHALGRGELNPEEIWSAYSRNLEYVFEHAMDLIDEIGGRTVVTSDHGVLMGENLGPTPLRGYGHPWNLRHDLLRTVPWGVVEGPRRSTNATRTGDGPSAVDNEVVNARLRNLGYAE